MKANRKFSEFTHNDSGAVGIGTMIVFIATILVAATAAAVLIDTSGKLQEKSQTTGTETTKEVASNLVVKGIYGTRNATDANGVVAWLNVTVSLAPGAEQVDLNQMVIRISQGATLKELTYSSSGDATDKFHAAKLRDDDTSWTAANPVMNAGDLVNIKIDLDTQSLTLGTRKDVDLALVPEIGSQVIADFSTPASFGTDTIIVLR